MARLAPLIEWDVPETGDMNWEGKGFTRYSNVLINFMLTELTADEVKVFMLLSSNAYGGYRLPRDMAILRTGLKKTKYYDARNGLRDKGWIEIVDVPTPRIIINLSRIKEMALCDKDEPNEREILTKN